VDALSKPRNSVAALLDGYIRLISLGNKIHQRLLGRLLRYPWFVDIWDRAGPDVDVFASLNSRDGTTLQASGPQETENREDGVSVAMGRKSRGGTLFPGLDIDVGG